MSWVEVAAIAAGALVLCLLQFAAGVWHVPSQIERERTPR
jgi:hypothetical protein